MIETMIAPAGEIVLPLASVPTHPGSVCFNSLICPSCGDRCGHLFAGSRCLSCEIGWQEQFVGAEDVVAHLCRRCYTEYPVLVAQDENGVWLTASDDACPMCGYSGTWFDLQTEDPDRYWGADERAAA